MYEEIIEKIIDELQKLKRASRLLNNRQEFNRRIRICLLKILSKHLGPGTRDQVPYDWNSIQSGINGLGANKSLDELEKLRNIMRTPHEIFTIGQERKYPDFYYNLSKSQQWKFRKNNPC